MSTSLCNLAKSALFILQKRKQVQGISVAQGLPPIQVWVFMDHFLVCGEAGEYEG